MTMLIIGMFLGAGIATLVLSALQIAKRSDTDYEIGTGVDRENGR